MRKPIPNFKHEFMEAGRYERLTNLRYPHSYFKFEMKTHNTDKHHEAPAKLQH